MTTTRNRQTSRDRPKGDPRKELLAIPGAATTNGTMRPNDLRPSEIDWARDQALRREESRASFLLLPPLRAGSISGNGLVLGEPYLPYFLNITSSRTTGSGSTVAA